MVTGRDFTIEASNEWFLQSIFTAVDVVAPLLFQRKWALMKAEAGEFITCGRPVALDWTDPKTSSGFFPPAFGLDGTDVLFPLSRHLAMLGRFEDRDRVQVFNRDGVVSITRVDRVTAISSSAR